MTSNYQITSQHHVHIMLLSRECFLLGYGAFDTLSSLYNTLDNTEQSKMSTMGLCERLEIILE